MYRFICKALRIIFIVIFRLKTIGIDNMPKDGGVILAVNHKSNWDVPIAASTSPRDLRFMAKSELFENKIFGGFITEMGAFPIRRGLGDIGAIKGALSILKTGNVMLMFPEGRRVTSGQVADAKSGIAMLAIKAKVPIQPVYISGEYKFLRKITVQYGEPIYLDSYYNEKLSAEELQKLSNNVLDNMRNLKIHN